MATHKRTIKLDDDNWADYFSDDYPSSLVQGLKVPEDGIDRDCPIVTKLLAWVARESGRSKDVRYEMNRPDAAVFLKELAGLPDSHWAAEVRPDAADASSSQSFLASGSGVGSGCATAVRAAETLRRGSGERSD
jgi:hypothetical protein